MQTVVGLYRTVSEANQVKQALVNEGYSGGDVTVIDQSESNYSTGTGTGTSYEGSETGDTGVGAKIKHFFQDLAGHDEHTHSAYTEGVSRGGALVAVNVSDGEVDRAAAVLRQHGATDIEGDDSYGTGTTATSGFTGGNQNYGTGTGTLGTTGTTGTTGLTGATGSTSSINGEQVIPIVEEELVVGKRQVERGGVRVYSRVVSEPVSESVNLHEERVVVDRRAVDRPATEADFVDAGPIEVRATGEEAVVGKTGRVVEEVLVGKTASDRTETVEDSVRRTEVDVEPVTTGVGTSTSRTTTDKY